MFYYLNCDYWGNSLKILKLNFKLRRKIKVNNKLDYFNFYHVIIIEIIIIWINKYCKVLN